MIDFRITSSRYRKYLLFVLSILTLTLVVSLPVMASETNAEIETAAKAEADRADKTEKQASESESATEFEAASESEAASEFVTASETKEASETEAQKQYVFDNYGLFSTEDLDALTAACIEYSEEAKADIIMITTNTLEGKTPTKYMEDFYDEMAFGYNEEFGDTVMLLVNMEEDNRWVEIQGYGKAEYYVNNDRIEHMLDDITLILKEGNYKEAFVEFAKQSAYYMNESKGVKETPASGGNSGSANSGSGNYGESGYDGPSDYYGEEKANPLYNTVVQLIIALIIGAISVGAMAAGSGGRMTAKGRTYLDEGRSGVLDRRDDYMRTTTTRVKKPSDNDSGGGRSSGGGGVSSGGHSHSGGGRSF